jgi:CheY-like chemotaxis protein
VLLDVGMAPLDGVQVLKRISEADYLRGIPVALLCATEAERQRAMRENVAGVRIRREAAVDGQPARPAAHGESALPR